MTSPTRNVLVAMVAVLCTAYSAPGSAQTPPQGWTAIAPPVDEEGWLCANWARDRWSVQLAESGTAVQIERAQTRPGSIALSVQGGRLIGTNRGEFGGALEWEPTGVSRRTLILTGNPVAFVASPAGLFLAEGLAHLSITRGRLLELERTDAKWTAKHVVGLGEAPEAVTVVGPTTLLVLTTSSVTEVDLVKKAATILFRNEQWGYLHGNSIVRVSSGTILVGMPRAVVALSPSSGGFIERWWVPSACTRLRRTTERATCECVGG
jgi:hypothetical protein